MNEELTVLVADDEPELLQAVCQLIDWQALGFRLVGRASNGLDALQRPDSHTRHSTTHSRPLPDIFCDPRNSDRPPAAEKPRCIPYTHPISLKFGITKFSIFGNTKYINHFSPYNFTGRGVMF